MTPDPDPDRARLALAKQEAWEEAERTRFAPLRMAAWDAYLSAWLALHEYDRAQWNETHPDIQVQPHDQ